MNKYSGGALEGEILKISLERAAGGDGGGGGVRTGNTAS